MTFCDFRKQFLLLPHQDMLREYWYRAGHPNCCDIGLPVQYHEATEPQKKGASAWGHLLAGAIAGGVSRTATAPLEVRFRCSPAGEQLSYTALVAGCRTHHD